MSISNASPGDPSRKGTYAVAEVDMDMGMEMPTATVISRANDLAEKHKAMESKAQESSDGIKRWPPALRDKIVQTFKEPTNERKGGEYLSRYDWPDGLKVTIYKSAKKIPLRFFIIDDSGSMILNDGRKVVKYGNQIK